MFRLLGIGVGIGGMIFVGACGTGNFHAVEGKVFWLDRKCSFTVTRRSTEGTKISSEQNSCATTDDFAKLRSAKERSQNIMGSAKIGVAFTLPGESEERVSTIKLTGQDDEFYELRKGDMVRLLVSKTDPENVRFY